MANVTNEPVAPTPAKRGWRVGVALLLVVLGWTGWHYHTVWRAAAEVAKRTANARTVPGLGLDLVWIAPGEFRMGSPEQSVMARWFYETREKLTHQPNPGNGSNDDEWPMTRVTLTQPFWLGRTEVTQAQWTALMGSNPSTFEGDDLPVEQVSWEDAMAFCRKLTERERAAGRLPAGYTYTLPTEAQWEYACRAGTTGDLAGDLDATAWYARNSDGTTHPVGTKQPNAWGLFDMHGNVWEWCKDWTTAHYPGGAVADPVWPAFQGARVERGGAWTSAVVECRTAYRNAEEPGERGFNVGFRVALSADRSWP